MKCRQVKAREASTGTCARAQEAHTFALTEHPRSMRCLQLQVKVGCPCKRGRQARGRQNTGGGLRTAFPRLHAGCCARVVRSTPPVLRSHFMRTSSHVDSPTGACAFPSTSPRSRGIPQGVVASRAPAAACADDPCPPPPPRMLASSPALRARHTAVAVSGHGADGESDVGRGKRATDRRRHAMRGRLSRG